MFNQDYEEHQDTDGNEEDNQYVNEQLSETCKQNTDDLHFKGSSFGRSFFFKLQSSDGMYNEDR